MKTSFTVGITSILVLILAVFSCDKSDTSPKPAESGQMLISFDNVVGTSDMSLNKGTYQNAAGESFVITKCNYFVSNIRLRKADGNEYVVPQDKSYFLIQEGKPASQLITLSDVPAGSYTGMTFTIGVDSLRSLADLDKRTGVLDPGLNEGMYWEWNSGYIFMKLEGTSSVAPAAQNNAFFYHVGGFGRLKNINNLRDVTLSFKNDMANVKANSTPSVQLRVDAMKIFNGPTKLSIAQYPSVMFDPYSVNIANNYDQMFSYDRIQMNQ